MKVSKILVLALGSVLLLSTGAMAKDKPEKNKSKKEKSLPYGLQKKVQRGGELPEGWQKKLQRGEVLDSELLKHSVLLDPKTYPSKYMDKNTQIFRLQDKVFRVIKDTNEILEILK